MDDLLAIRYSLRNFIQKSQGLRFVLVGGINTLFGYTLFALFTYCGLHYTVAALLSTSISAVFNFITTGSLVFNRVHSRLFLRFIIVYILVYFVSIAMLRIGTCFSQNIYLDGAAALPLTATVAFFLNKYFVFERPAYETH